MYLEEALKLIKCLDAVKDKSCSDGIDSNILSVGKKVFIRTVTHYYTGQIKKLYSQFIELEDAAWIADTGRFHDFLKEGTCNEYEGFVDPVLVPLSAIVDITPWGHKLFTGKK